MLRSLQRRAELLELRGSSFLIHKDTIWCNSNGIIQPIGPAKFDYSISVNEAKYILKRLKGRLIRWTDGFSDKKCSEFYAVICKKPIELEKIPAKRRSEIKRGLNNCIVEKVSTKFVAENAYEVYIRSFDRYRNVRVPKISEQAFKNNMLATAEFEDIHDYWVVFYKNKLIAYAHVNLYDKIEAEYTHISFHPEYLQYYPSYALLYKMNEYYLKEMAFEYVNDGFRNLLHQTNIQEFLQKKFNFHKANTNLFVLYDNMLEILISFSYPFKNILKIFSPKLEALYRLEHIKRQCASHKVSINE